MVSTPVDPPRLPDELHARAQDDIALLALGEPADAAIAAHVDACPQCRHEVASYRQLIALARDSGRGAEPPPPPPHLWDGIVAALGDEAPGAPKPVPTNTEPPQSHAAGPAPAPVRDLTERIRGRRLRSLLAAAAVVALIAAGAVGWTIGHTGRSSGATSASEAVLAPLPGSVSGAQGKADVRSSRDGYTLHVSTDRLPAPQGYYEVWLYNPSINQMVAVGTLGSGQRGTFTVPEGIDLNAYHVIDVSAQRYDGNNTHERSVLRGSLVQ